jgi:hypothetical protein
MTHGTLVLRKAQRTGVGGWHKISLSVHLSEKRLLGQMPAKSGYRYVPPASEGHGGVGEP